MSKQNVVKTSKGFKVSKSDKQLDKEAREQRMNERKVADKSRVTNTELFEYLQDTNDRLSEIYDMLNGK
ncbi:hypothetical protein [Schinkia azotoformans]|uniref:hypothetical protein n=1 Tax=Schinkia azotoformans TaxID=1454 RepID=UPI002DB8287E|nr:hypothetical protein [Schinkia azotoformans]MEC1757359.1 hypothetical protein [Schinkia azotoformans]